MHSSRFTRRRSRFTALVLLLSAAGLSASGCSNYIWNTESPDGVGPTDLGTIWSNSIGRMGVAAIMPPSEDVKVGDIYVYPINPDYSVAEGGNPRVGVLAASPRWASLDLLQELEREYGLRPDWPATPDPRFQSSQDDDERDWSEPRNPEGQSIFARNQSTDRLRNVIIPEFNSLTLTEGDLNAIVPTEAINLVFGSAWSDDKAVTVRLNALETYSLGLQKVIESALEFDGGGYSLKAPYRNHLHLVSTPDSEVVWVRILSDVIYARSVDIVIQSQAGFTPDEEASASDFIAEVEEPEQEDGVEAQAAAEDEDGEAQDEQTAGERAEEEQDEIAALPDHSLDPSYAAFVRANAINEILIESGTDGLPGGYLRFISVTDDSVTVRRVSQRGLAVGARGLTLEVDKLTGQVTRSSNMSRMLPPPAPTPVAE